MNERYKTYKSGRKSPKKESQYINKLKKQIIISVICFTLIYWGNTSNTQTGNMLTQSLKSMLEYQIDTGGIQNSINDFWNAVTKTNKNTNEEKTNEEIKQNTAFENL